ncbi:MULTISPECIES: hypothetical protein [Stappiaceae]|jgi:hypothetical protein|uniref:Uncharacterized protein n=1 Tax=Roseibium aggregatum TaxID=187304 RepID=A0A0M6Y0Q9_9HYPH|nr:MULTISPECIES: hypothetical protein [Stappiaceae]MEC9417402.1 hypothetical protein [Pseudomonadota bacterium]MBO9459266.1 hypothetical protein [Labrenzia sp. R5_0]MEC9471449.1 hypothetical protein [Pseudomonadota bacterium]MEE2865772.1 hypothetical protein [Pseudomonadota bacterium]NKI56701.1 hypothetical protein [Labrenzia sp. PO1]
MGKGKAEQSATASLAESGRRSGQGAIAVAAVLIAVSLAACTRPTGDFDRARPSVIHDRVMPAAGDEAARLRGDPVSKFNYTNDEKLMRNRGWTLIRPPWTKDWIGGTMVELSRTRVLPEVEGRVPPDLYLIYLRSDKFQSSDARYDKIAADASGDAELVMPFCEVALRVKAADDERLRVLQNKPVKSEETYEGAKARVWENRVMIKWVGQALRYRIIAYKKALDGLEIETPTRDRVWKVNNAIRELEGQVRIAEAGCDPDKRYGDDKPVRRSRIYTGWGTERAPVVK